MGVLVQNRAVQSSAANRRDLSRFFSVRMLRAIARLIDSYPWTVYLLVTMGCCWIRVGAFATRFLDHDELYSFYIAQASSLKQLFYLTQTVDLHPPLSYLLIRLSFTVFGPTTWACRLPFLLAFLCTTAALFVFVRRLLSPLYGVITVLFLWCVPYTHFAAEARPYSLVLCFTSVMLLSWYRCISHGESSTGGRRAALPALAAAEFGLLLSHVLGVFSVAAFAGAELVRFLIRRKQDRMLWIALLIPCASVLTYFPLIHSGSTILFTEKYRATPARLFHLYWAYLTWLPIPLACVILLAALWPKAGKSKPGTVPSITPTALRSLSFLLFAFAMVPLGVGAIFARTGVAFFDRYGIVFLISMAATPALLLGLRTQCNRVPASLVALVLGAVLVFNTVGKAWFIEQVSIAPPKVAEMLIHLMSLPVVGMPKTPPAPIHPILTAPNAGPVRDLDAVEPDIPIVANTGLTFLELDREADDTLATRLYLLNDISAATEITHDTVFENYARLKQVFPIRGRVDPFCPFIAQHHEFLVVGDYNHAQGWLLKKLDRDGAELRILGTYDDHTTEDGHIYEVTVKSSTCPPQAVQAGPQVSALMR